MGEEGNEIIDIFSGVSYLVKGVWVRGDKLLDDLPERRLLERRKNDRRTSERRRERGADFSTPQAKVS